MERFADFVVTNRIKVAIVTLLLAFGVFAGIPNLKLDTDGRVFMAADNPDKFVLDAAANSKGVVEQRQRRPENIQQAGFGQRRSPLLQAYIDEDPTGATEKRISDFERSNTIKACAIIACLFVFVITWDPVVP